MTAPQKNTFLLGVAAIFAAATLFGIAGALAKALFHADISPIALSAIRSFLACIFFAAIMVAVPRMSFRISRKSLPILIAAGLAFTTVNILFYLAVSMISVASAITLEYTAPFFVLLISFFIGTKRITTADVGIVLVSVVGCFLLAWEDGGWLRSLPGILVGLACGCAFAVYHLIGNACKARDISATTVTFYSFFISALLWLAILPWLDLHEITFSRQSILYIGFIVVFATALPYWLLLYGLRQVHALPATVIGMLDPLTAGVVAFFLLGEVLTTPNVTGIALIIAAVCAFAAKENAMQKNA